MLRKREKAKWVARALVARNGHERKDLGVYYTPPELCRFLAERTLALARAQKSSHLTVCDPMVGGGAFLEAARQIAGDSVTLYGVDIDPRAVRMTRRRLGLSSRQVKVGNALVSPMLAEDDGRFVHAKRSLIPRLIAERLGPILGPRTSSFRPFCWELEFPEIFAPAEPGFDIVIGNPPWNNLRPDDREFFTRFDRAFRLLPSRAERDRRARALLRSARVRAEYGDYLDCFRRWNALVRSGRFYRNQGGPGNGQRVYKIEHNLYKLALERAWTLTKPGGFIALLVPAGFLGDLGASQLRRLYFDGGACRGLWSFPENAREFDAAQAFVAVIFEKAGTPGPFRLVGWAESSRPTLGTFTRNGGPRGLGPPYAPLAERKGDLSLALIRRTAPVTYAVPALAGPHDPAILDKLYRHPPLGEINPGDPWVARPTRELHTRDDRDLFVHRDTGIPALKGADLEAFALRRPFRLWVDPQAYATRAKHSAASRVAWRAIANVHLARRLQAALIPPRHALLNSLNYFIPEQPEAVKYYLLALLNSLVLEWRVRQLAKNNNINQYVIASLPVPRLEPGDARFDSIVALSGRLMHSGNCGPNDADRATRARATHAGARTRVAPALVAGDLNRLALQSTLDARVAALYDLSQAELAAMLAQFPRLPAAQKQRVLDAFAVLRK